MGGLDRGGGGGGGPQKVFGQSMTRKNKNGGGGRTSYQRQMGQSGRTSMGISAPTQVATMTEEEEKAQRAAEYKLQKKLEGLAHDSDFLTIPTINTNDHKGRSRRGWIYNMIPTTVDVANDEATAEKAALDLYCLDNAGGTTFKCTVVYQPYFYICPSKEFYENDTVDDDDDDDNNHVSGKWQTLISHVTRQYEPMGLQSTKIVSLQDLDMANHLSPTCRGRKVLKLMFDTQQQLNDVKREIMTLVDQNKQRNEHALHSMTRFFQTSSTSTNNNDDRDPLMNIDDIREYDVPYTLRVCIDLNIRAGTWYTITPSSEDFYDVTFEDADNTKRAEPTVLAFDIECTKAPLKFPDATAGDEIFMISYMINSKGYLITSRTVVSENIEDFEYTPSPQFPGTFEIFNEQNEEALIRRFFDHYRQVKPHIVVTYNGDFFDWPFLEARAKHYGLSMEERLGIGAFQVGDYRGRTAVHLDAFHWVRRDSYLPQGSQGLKAVTKYKLGYDPVEVDPEDMVPFAMEQPVKMATYSVSDAVATFYLYQTYVHFFIFSLATIIPMNPEDVLRKGSGTLCEALLMVEAYDKQIICPNKQVDRLEQFHNGHLLESETYIGGKVECLETGVYRSDIEYDFDMVPSAYDGLISKVDRDLTFSIEVEGHKKVEDIENYDEIKQDIIHKLEELRDRPKRKERPFVYHLDVGAMYPNIILTNRLQPSAIVSDDICASCDYNQQSSNCKRPMKWIWRGDYNPATKAEYEQTKQQLLHEMIDDKPFMELSKREQAKLISTRLKRYSKNAYNTTKVTQEETRTSTVCMRENDFYVATVLRFRDRRYELKKLTKVSKKAASKASTPAEKKDAEDKVVIYDSLQVAHKCILNSFYGYVMRKGARWRSMEMAGVVTKTGADLITQARILVEQIGRPLELDTDGIWCILPRSFPDVYTFKLKDGSGTLKLEYPCVMLNADVHANFSNHQYQTLDPTTGNYTTRSECSIFFEVDGPYRCMVLPASTEEGKLLKKRYAVFNFDGSLAELKGFELKRRGELELIKAFQSQVFERFLDGSSLEECYDAVADIANHWMDVLDTQGESLDVDELFDLISENRNMSKQLDEYGGQKGTSQTTARRLSEFLGAEIIKNAGLNCKFIIAERPYGAPVTERAIPTAIWKAEPAVKKHFLKQWLKAPELDDFDVRNIVDWDYYRERLAKTIQKIITIPAALQDVANPVPRIAHPEWLDKTVARKHDRFQQESLINMFQKQQTKNDKTKKNQQDQHTASTTTVMDIEDVMTPSSLTRRSTKPNTVVSPEGVTTTTPTRTNHDNDNGKVTTNKRRVSIDIRGAASPPRQHAKLSGDHFEEWLAQRKQAWRAAKRDRRSLVKMRNGGTTGNGSMGGMKKAKTTNGATTGGSTMMGYLQDAALAIQQEEWHVIELRETSATSGEYVAWVMMGGSGSSGDRTTKHHTLQRIHVTAPRTIYVNCASELTIIGNGSNGGMLSLRKVTSHHLPHGKASMNLYEIQMSEPLFQGHKWQHMLTTVDVQKKSSKTNTSTAQSQTSLQHLIEGVYESKTPLLYQVLLHLGSVTKVSSQGGDKQMSKRITDNNNSSNVFSLHELSRVDRPTLGYLHSSLSYRRLFFYDGINPKTKTGVIALFVMEGGSGDYGTRGTNNQQGDDGGINVDVTIPIASGQGTLRADAKCLVWIVKPGASKSQKAITKERCEHLFQQLLSQILDLAAETGDDDEDIEKSSLACLSQKSKCVMNHLGFVDTEPNAYGQINQKLQQYLQEKRGPTLLLVNSTYKAVSTLRKQLPNSIEFPFVQLPLPPSSTASNIPPLNWEPVAVQLCMEAYFHMVAVTFPERVKHARFGNIPIGNLGYDDRMQLYDITFGRQLKKSRAVLWSNFPLGVPDLGCNLLEAGESSSLLSLNGSSSGGGAVYTTGENDLTLSPIVCHPGMYRTMCIEVEIHNLSIAALLDPMSEATMMSTMNHNNATSGATLDGKQQQRMTMVGDDTLGDAMACQFSYHMLRGMVQLWLNDVIQHHNVVADELLHHLYRILCTPESYMYDPALHRVIHSKMVTMFHRLLSEFHLLGAKIISATFNRVVIATKHHAVLSAMEYINFVIATIQKRGSHQGLDRITLRPSKVWSHYNLLDQHNVCGIQFQPREPLTEDEAKWTFAEGGGDDEQIFVPTAICSWMASNFLAGEDAKRWFRSIVSRFSREVWRKEVIVRRKMDAQTSSNGQPMLNAVAKKKEMDTTLQQYKKKLVSQQFASELTYRVGEILKTMGGPGHAELFPILPGSHLPLEDPSLEFVKHVIKAFRLDRDVEQEVNALNRSLLTQIGVQEYALKTQWKNPCADFVLPDVFCPECHEGRDVNLCCLPPNMNDDDTSEEEQKEMAWICEDCECPYDKELIEWRLVCLIQQRSMQYQCQDLRCTKTQAVATRNLSTTSPVSLGTLSQDFTRNDMILQLYTLKALAEFHELEWLFEVVEGLMTNIMPPSVSHN